MKTKSIMLAGVLCAGLFASGCRTPGVPDPNAEARRVAQLATVAEMAAFTGTSIRLQAHPDEQARFMAVREMLRLLGGATNVNPAAFSAALKQLPVKELQGPSGELIIGSAIILYDAFAREHVNLDANIWLRPIVEATERGITRGLGGL